uniref:EXS domain-containing protein n=1 Tax=Spumella elongata TaxID=89044 RepID=A0A7S3M1D3_9STRA
MELEHTELSQSTHPERSVYHASANLCMLFLFAFVLFNKAVRGGYFGPNGDLTVAHAIPAALAVFCGVRLCFPCQTRQSWMHMLWRVSAAPFYLVNFRDGYVGDLLTSLVRVFIPMFFSVIYVSETAYAWLSNDFTLTADRSGSWLTEAFYYRFLLLPVLTLFPLWLRLLQCLRRSVDTGKRWPHIGNALKYTSAIVVISFGTFQPAIRSNPVWIGAFVFATLFQFAWDLTQDWGMVQFTPPRHDIPTASSSGLAAVDCLVHTRVSFRKTRLLGPLRNYLAVILFNLTLRFAWTLTLLPAPAVADGASPLFVFAMRHLGPLLASLEILRRMVWGFFRLEWEQIEQLGKTKNEDVLKSASFSDLGQLDQMDVSSALEMQPMTSYITSNNVPSDDAQELWTETDGIAFLPSYVARSIDTSRYLRNCVSYQAKLRAVEAGIFVFAVLYVVALAAAPAYA